MGRAARYAGLLVLLAVVMTGCGQSESYRRGQDAGRVIASEGYLNEGYARELCRNLAAMDGGNASDFVDGCMDGWGG